MQLEEEEEKEEEIDTTRTTGGARGLSRRLRERLADEISAQEKTVAKVPTEDQKRIVQQDVDLNGVDPITCILGAVPVAALSYGFWTFTESAAAWFVSHPITTDFYPAQRLGIVFQTALIGLSSLAAGIFGFTALGLLLLGFRVAAGVMSGELDPKKESTEPMKQSTAERVRDFLTKDPVETALAQRRARGESSKESGSGA